MLLSDFFPSVIFFLPPSYFTRTSPMRAIPGIGYAIRGGRVVGERASQMDLWYFCGSKSSSNRRRGFGAEEVGGRPEDTRQDSLSVPLTPFFGTCSSGVIL
jgi:hypothetical protein